MVREENSGYYGRDKKLEVLVSKLMKRYTCYHKINWRYDIVKIKRLRKENERREGLSVEGRADAK